ncbi:pyridoxal phosphate-dependent transferase [Fimicolochytrium jonesii]|uniref:pyridoxal phosphate-dependent transferase n=1 Tax=Fimicolochytrium jonesii TaxID=1396493 RepID=UPI0022FF3B90|nr:pyridoxal phosphate-dependent transferase [Fimicolochytrium jonesii]KAI8827162.1 pyridoxal phosphate-dependent transferase [Fimicolochytrium jonesii]
MAPTTPATTVWDTKTQQFHGGQEWQFIDNFVEDFSVTTNGLGLPKKALQAARDSLDISHHYPAADQEPAKTNLAKFYAPDGFESVHERLLLGNGASELIDLVTRAAPEGPWKPGPWTVQYKEYERSAIALGRKVLAPKDATPASLTCIVNPNNPTGDYMNIEALKKYIEETVADNTDVMVDESMQPWHSPSFRSDSLISQPTWIANLFQTRGIAVYLIHSWTKLWSCTGLRLGSLVCPTVAHCTALKKVQVPWSVNVPALAFLQVVTSSDEQPFLDETWAVTTPWRTYTVDALTTLGQHVNSGKGWTITGEPFLSWVWIDMHDAEVAAQAVELAKRAGVPVRSGVPGYACHTCVRAAVRKPELVDKLVRAWQPLVKA